MDGFGQSFETVEFWSNEYHDPSNASSQNVGATSAMSTGEPLVADLDIESTCSYVPALGIGLESFRTCDEKAISLIEVGIVTVWAGLDIHPGIWG